MLYVVAAGGCRYRSAPDLFRLCTAVCTPGPWQGLQPAPRWSSPSDGPLCSTSLGAWVWCGPSFGSDQQPPPHMTTRSCQKRSENMSQKIPSPRYTHICSPASQGFPDYPLRSRDIALTHESPQKIIRGCSRRQIAERAFRWPDKEVSQELMCNGNLDMHCTLSGA